MITLIYSTARKQPHFDWLMESLCRCSYRELVTQIVIVDFFAQACDDWSELDVARRRNEVYIQAQKFSRLHNCEVDWQPPKPNVWGGKFRFTPRNWWHKSSALNTGACLAKGKYLVFSDDRCVFLPLFLDAVKESIDGNYAVCGTYEKGHHLVVENGELKSFIEPKDENGKPTGKDGRAKVAQGRKMICPGTWMYGHAFGLPTEWFLQVNGVDESWDSVSMEDTHFGQMLENNGFAIFHDPRMAQVQDRTPDQHDHDMKRSSKEKHSGDKSDKTHKLIERLWNNRKSDNGYDLRALRKSVLAGNPFPIMLGPKVDWFDQQPLEEMI